MMTQPALLCLTGENFVSGDLGWMLARQNILIPVAAQPASEAAVAAVIAQAASAGAQQFALLASREHAALALQIAALNGERIHALVLLAPQALDEHGAAQDAALTAQLPNIKAQTLVVFGTRDEAAPPDHATRYKRALPSCHIMLVYDAADPECERADAVFEAVSDFLARREGFLVNNLDGKIFA